MRIHEGPQPARIGAIAFTTGTDIYFAPGRYQPHTPQGQHLLGHELAHVMQQRQGRAKAPAGAALAVVHDRGLEMEADQLGQRAAAWLRRPPSCANPSPSPPRNSMIQRATGERIPNPFGDDPSEPLLIEDWKVDYRKELSSISKRDHSDLKKIVNCLDADFLISYFKIDPFEKMALYYYGSPGKHDPSGDVYMGPHPKWGKYNNGWNALSSALEKLPSFETLGLENLPLFRVERSDSKLFDTLKKSGPIYIFHGVRPMEFGQYHTLSTSLMPSAGHNAIKGNYSRGLFIYHSKSARYFNIFSIQGMVDGGETLIPPGAITLFKGIGKEYWMGELVDCAVLEEVGTVNLLKGKNS